MTSKPQINEKYLNPDGSLMNAAQFKEFQLKRRLQRQQSELEKKQQQQQNKIDMNVSVNINASTSMINPNKSLLHLMPSKEKIFENLVKQSTKNLHHFTSINRNLLDEESQNFISLIQNNKKNEKVTYEEFLKGDKIRKIELNCPFIKKRGDDKFKKVNDSMVLKGHIHHYKIHNNYVDVLNNIVRKHHIKYVDKNTFDRNILNKGEYYTYYETEEDTSQSETESISSIDSYSRPSKIAKGEEKEKIKIQKLETEKELKRAKVKKFLEVNQKIIPKITKELEISEYIPFDFIINESITICSSIDLQLDSINEDTYTLASSFYAPLLKNKLSNFNINNGEGDNKAKLIAHLIHYEYPTEEVEPFLQSRISNVLGKCEKNKMLDLEETNYLNIFEKIQQKWKETFKNLFKMFQLGVIPYFYYFNNDFNVLFLNKDFSNNSESQLVALIDNTDAKLMKNLKLFDIRYKDYVPPELKYDHQIARSLQSASRKQYLNYIKTLRHEDNRNQKSATNKQIIVEKLDDLFKYLLDYVPKNHQKYVKKMPLLLAPMQFLNSIERVPKIKYNQQTLKIENQLILPLQLQAFLNHLLRTEKEIEFIDIYTQPYIPSIAYLGKWVQNNQLKDNRFTKEQLNDPNFIINLKNEGFDIVINNKIVLFKRLFMNRWYY